MPDEKGQRYIPGISRDFGNNVLTSTTAGDVVNLYHVQTLNADCYREVTALEYCYRYNTTVPVEAVFNWTVLIFEETNFFTVIKIYALESHPSSLSERECMNVSRGRAECCDQKVIEDFNIPMATNFVFGVTESAQGNTAGATLLAFLDDDEFTVQPEYVVYTVQIHKEGLNLSVGSQLNRTNTGTQRGLRMLWFVTGKPLSWYHKNNS